MGGNDLGGVVAVLLLLMIAGAGKITRWLALTSPPSLTTARANATTGLTLPGGGSGGVSRADAVDALGLPHGGAMRAVMSL